MLISLVHSRLKRLPSSTVHSNVARWEEDLKAHEALLDWQAMWSSTTSLTINITILESAGKGMTRWYMSPVKLAHMFSGHTGLCFRGCQTTGDVLHIWWTCPMLGCFSSRVFSLLRMLLGVQLTKDSSCIITLQTSLNANLKLVHFDLLASKILIAKAWKMQFTRFAEVESRLDGIFNNEQLTSILTKSHNKFLKIWRPWLTYWHPKIPLESLAAA